MSELLLFQKVILALAIGALVGIEREKRARREIFAGIRTFPLVCLLGLLISYLSSLNSKFCSALLRFICSFALSNFELLV